jgi:hypothetical protein
MQSRAIHINVSCIDLQENRNELATAVRWHFENCESKRFREALCDLGRAGPSCVYDPLHCGGHSWRKPK